MDPFKGKGRIRRAAESRDPFEELVSLLRGLGMSKRQERTVRARWADSDDATRAFLLSVPAPEWKAAAAARGGIATMFDEDA